METKPFYKSKTLWANLLAGLAAILTSFGFTFGLDPENQTAIIGGIMAIANMLLRLTTVAPVGMGAADE